MLAFGLLQESPNLLGHCRADGLENAGVLGDVHRSIRGQHSAKHSELQVLMPMDETGQGGSAKLVASLLQFVLGTVFLWL